MAREHILVVDDERDLADLVAINLELKGYRVSTANNGVEALDAVGRERPDLLLLDVMMPRMDGWAVLATLQRDPRTRDLPVVMLTALSGEHDLIRGRLSGAVRYVTKPFDLETLLDAVREELQPLDAAAREARAEQLRGLLRRLAELETGREGATRVRFSRLESPPRPTAPSATEQTTVSLLSPRQREIAGLLGIGWDARQIAVRLGTSRSNVYAARKRIARHLGVPAEQVADEARRLGITAEDG